LAVSVVVSTAAVAVAVVVAATVAALCVGGTGGTVPDQAGNHHKGSCGRWWTTATARTVTVLEVSKGRSRRRRGAGTVVVGSHAGRLRAVLEAGKKKW